MKNIVKKEAIREFQEQVKKHSNKGKLKLKSTRGETLQGATRKGEKEEDLKQRTEAQLKQKSLRTNN